MNKENIYSAIEKKINEEYFTGRVTLREIFSEQVHNEQEMYHVTFHNGARTTLHYHESDQILVARVFMSCSQICATIIKAIQIQIKL
jgi:quercetin dioxygenase-like cupin family protein